VRGGGVGGAGRGREVGEGVRREWCDGLGGGTGLVGCRGGGGVGGGGGGGVVWGRGGGLGGGGGGAREGVCGEWGRCRRVA